MTNLFLWPLIGFPLYLLLIGKLGDYIKLAEVSFSSASLPNPIAGYNATATTLATPYAVAPTPGQAVGLGLASGGFGTGA